jgi:hypothetical protein
MGKLGIDDMEDLRSARLGSDDIEELLDVATECNLVFSGPDDWPMGVVVSFARAGGRFWFTAVEGRRHTVGISRHPRISIVVTSAGTDLDGRRMVAVRAMATVHTDRPTKDRILPVIAARLSPDDPTRMLRLLDTEHRVVIEAEPTAVSVSHDSRKIAGDGRGGPGEPVKADRQQMREGDHR